MVHRLHRSSSKSAATCSPVSAHKSRPKRKTCTKWLSSLKQTFHQAATTSKIEEISPGCGLETTSALALLEGNHVMTLDQFTEPKLLVPGLRGVTQMRVIAELIVRLRDGAISDGKEFYEAVMQQERNSGPIAARGIGFACGRSPVARKLSIAAGLSAVGIQWPGDAENKMHAVFVAAIPLDQEQNCTAIETAIMSLANDEMAYHALITCQQPEEMHSVLRSVHVIPSAYSNQRANRAV